MRASFMSLLVIICLALVITSSSALTSASHNVTKFNRASFPPGFLFGAASSSYQNEGAVTEGGRGPSIWDTFTHNFPEKIADGSNGDIGVDFYHRYKEDIKLMKHLGFNTFRMSISWSRILPRGKLSGGINKEGIAFYNNVFNELLTNGITPFVTLFHWDLPQALEDDYRGFLSPLLVNDFVNFANLCFKEFGDRIKYWSTFNEPFIFITTGYDGQFAGSLAPGRCSYWANCSQGDSATEPYVVAHNLLLCHAASVRLYRQKYQATLKGEIGIVLVTHMMVPASNSTQDVQAAQRALDFLYGWFAHPVVYGDYPESMRTFVGDRLPEFTDEQKKMLIGSCDFVGLNYYTGNYASHITTREGNVSSTSDKMVHLSPTLSGRPLGAPTGVGIFYDYPKGLRDLLVYIKDKYKNPVIYITENGMGDIDNGTAYGVNDPQRIRFYNGHLRAVLEAIKSGVRVRGFIAWSFMDNFEWGNGHTIRFGLVFVDFKNGLKRIPKRSALWFRKFLLNKN